MLPRPPNKSESAARRPGSDARRPGRPERSSPCGTDGGPAGRAPAAAGRQPQRPLNASFSRENSPCCPGWNCPVGRSSPRSLASSRSSSLLLGVELGRGLRPRRGRCRSPRPPPRRCVTPRPCSGIDWPDWVPGRMSTSSSAVQRLQRHLGAERRRRHREGDRAVQVVAAPLEDRVRPLVDLDVQVAGGAAAGADLALAGELDARAVVDPGRDLDGERAAGADPAVAGALGARGRDDGAEALALRARPGRHDLAEEGPVHLRHLAAAAAHVAGLRGGCRAPRPRRCRWCRRPPCRPGCPWWCRRRPRRGRARAGSSRPGRAGCAGAARAATPCRRTRP